jgi:hypothetical protein
MAEGNPREIPSSSAPELGYRADALEPLSSAGQLAALLIKILAIYLFAQCVALIPILVGAVVATLVQGQRFRYQDILISSTYYVGVLLAGVLLLWNANRIARRVTPPSADAGPQDRINGREAQAIAFSALGIYFLVSALPRLLNDIVVVATNPTWRGAGFVEYLQTFISPIVQTVLGLVLFLRARGLALLWHRIRSTRRYGDESQPEQDNQASQL